MPDITLLQCCTDTVVIPFGNFSDCWDDATGGIIHSCEEDKQFCPTTKVLKDIETISFWGEGVAGLVHLEIAQISATECS